MSDGDLVRRTLSGQPGAFEDLVRRWAGRILAFCHAKLSRGDAAEDLAQEALMRAYRALATLTEPEKFGAWLFGIAHRACLDWLKAKERSQVTFGTLGPDKNPDDFLGRQVPVSEPDVERDDEARKLMGEVETLPEEYREALMLYYYNEMTYRDMGALLGVSPATINARLTKARAMLRERMSGSRR